MLKLEKNRKRKEKTKQLTAKEKYEKLMKNK